MPARTQTPCPCHLPPSPHIWGWPKEQRALPWGPPHPRVLLGSSPFGCCWMPWPPLTELWEENLILCPGYFLKWEIHQKSISNNVYSYADAMALWSGGLLEWRGGNFRMCVYEAQQISPPPQRAFIKLEKGVKNRHFKSLKSDHRPYKIGPASSQFPCETLKILHCLPVPPTVPSLTLHHSNGLLFPIQLLTMFKSKTKKCNVRVVWKMGGVGEYIGFSRLFFPPSSHPCKQACPRWRERWWWQSLEAPEDAAVLATSWHFPVCRRSPFPQGPGDNRTFIFLLNEISSQEARDPALLPENDSPVGESNGGNKGTFISVWEE